MTARFVVPSPNQMCRLDANSRTIKLLIHLVEQHATAAYDIVELTKLFGGTPHHTAIACHGPDNDWSRHRCLVQAHPGSHQQTQTRSQALLLLLLPAFSEGGGQESEAKAGS